VAWRLGLAAVAAVVLGFTFAGCGKKQELPKMTVDPAKKPPEGGEVIVRQEPKDSPDWVNNPGALAKKEKETLFFVGIGLPNEYEQKADDSAALQAGVEAARYLFNMVDVKEFISDKLRNSQGFTPVQALARDTVGQNVAAAIVRGNYGVSRFSQYCCRTEYGAQVYYFKVYRLFELPRKSVNDAIEKSRERIQQEYQKERDEIKKELLKGSDDMLKAMEKELMGGKAGPEKEKETK